MFEIHSFCDIEGSYSVSGICVCGLGATMQWAYAVPDGTLIPKCGKCARGDKTGSYARITKEMLECFRILHVMSA